MSYILVDKTFLLLIIIAILVFYQYYRSTNQIHQQSQQIIPITSNNDVVRAIESVSKKIDNKNISVEITHPVKKPVDLLRQYDYKSLVDPLVPPLKRDDWNIPIVPIPSRGFPTAFKKVGMLVDSTANNTDPYKFLLLIGRQKYRGSDWYEYYAIEKNMSEGSLKFDLEHIRRELMTGDTVTIKQLNKTYEVHIDRSLGHEYYPFIY